MPDRHILRLTGPDVHPFLQGLVTNDVGKLQQGAIYTALLTPQGKLITDFFLVPDGDAVLLDAPASAGPQLATRLGMYKLRADVTITPADLHLHRGTGPAPADGFADPRLPELGWRAYRTDPQTDDTTDWTALRVAHMVPEFGAELDDNTYILEAGFERLNGVDFRKGCYVGQEVTARMKHKTTLRKGFARVALSAPVDTGTPVTAAGKTVGQLHSVSGQEAIAYLRFDKAEGGMQAGPASVTLL
jgi:folate-binding protein YgfZ